MANQCEVGDPQENQASKTTTTEVVDETSTASKVE